MKRISVILIILVVLILLFPIGASSIAQQGTKTPIKHVINIYLENHTFDNYFGTYPESPGSPMQSVINELPVPLNLLNNKSLSNKLTAIPPGTFNTPDPIEGYTAYHLDWNHGLMNNFVNGSGPYSMTYYTSSQLGPIWDLAEEYSIADMYFSPLLTESAPNTMYYLSGYSPVFNDYGPPPSVPFSQTIFGELSSYNISWGIYIPTMKQEYSYSEWIQIAGMNAHIGNVSSWNNFVSQLHAGSIPSVSYVFSQEAQGTDQAAPSNILKGEMWLFYLINQIEESPVWNSTAIFITWDDPGGYYDQVSPPIVDGQQLGFRLPLIVVSPYAKEAYVSNTILTHSSILAFIDYNWRLPALNRFVSNVNIPTDLFNFNNSYSNGNIVREPIVFSFGHSFIIPSEPIFNLTGNFSNLNLSDVFPQSPQLNLSSLPYSNEGSTYLTLSSLNSPVFVSNNFEIMPFYASPYFLLGLIILDVILFSIGFRGKKVKK